MSAYGNDSPQLVRTTCDGCGQQRVCTYGYACPAACGGACGTDGCVPVLALCALCGPESMRRGAGPVLDVPGPAPDPHLPPWARPPTPAETARYDQMDAAWRDDRRANPRGARRWLTALWWRLRGWDREDPEWVAEARKVKPLLEP